MTHKPGTFQGAFYKGTRPGVQGIYSRAVRVADQGPYSHCELIFSDGQSASASFIDGGVRFKTIDYKPENWDFVDLPPGLESAARAWFEARRGVQYDWRGNIWFVLPFIQHDPDKEFCSGAGAAALGYRDPWRLGPNGLWAVLPSLEA